MPMIFDQNHLDSEEKYANLKRLAYIMHQVEAESGDAYRILREHDKKHKVFNADGTYKGNAKKALKLIAENKRALGLSIDDKKGVERMYNFATTLGGGSVADAATIDNNHNEYVSLRDQQNNEARTNFTEKKTAYKQTKKTRRACTRKVVGKVVLAALATALVAGGIGLFGLGAYTLVNATLTGFGLTSGLAVGGLFVGVVAGRALFRAASKLLKKTYSAVVAAVKERQTAKTNVKTANSQYKEAVKQRNNCNTHVARDQVAENNHRYPAMDSFGIDSSYTRVTPTRGRSVPTAELTGELTGERVPAVEVGAGDELEPDEDRVIPPAAETPLIGAHPAPTSGLAGDRHVTPATVSALSDADRELLHELSGKVDVLINAITSATSNSPQGEQNRGWANPGQAAQFGPQNLYGANPGAPAAPIQQQGEQNRGGANPVASENPASRGSRAGAPVTSPRPAEGELSEEEARARWMELFNRTNNQPSSNDGDERARSFGYTYVPPVIPIVPPVEPAKPAKKATEPKKPASASKKVYKVPAGAADLDQAFAREMAGIRTEDSVAKDSDLAKYGLDTSVEHITNLIKTSNRAHNEKYSQSKFAEDFKEVYGYVPSENEDEAGVFTNVAEMNADISGLDASELRDDARYALLSRNPDYSQKIITMAFIDLVHKKAKKKRAEKGPAKKTAAAAAKVPKEKPAEPVAEVEPEAFRAQLCDEVWNGSAGIDFGKLVQGAIKSSPDEDAVQIIIDAHMGQYRDAVNREIAKRRAEHPEIFNDKVDECLNSTNLSSYIYGRGMNMIKEEGLALAAIPAPIPFVGLADLRPDIAMRIVAENAWEQVKGDEEFASIVSAKPTVAEQKAEVDNWVNSVLRGFMVSIVHNYNHPSSPVVADDKKFQPTEDQYDAICGRVMWALERDIDNMAARAREAKRTGEAIPEPIDQRQVIDEIYAQAARNINLPFTALRALAKSDKSAQRQALDELYNGPYKEEIKRVISEYNANLPAGAAKIEISDEELDWQVKRMARDRFNYEYAPREEDPDYGFGYIENSDETPEETTDETPEVGSASGRPIVGKKAKKKPISRDALETQFTKVSNQMRLSEVVAGICNRSYLSNEKKAAQIDSLKDGIATMMMRGLGIDKNNPADAPDAQKVNEFVQKKLDKLKKDRKLGKKDDAVLAYDLVVPEDLNKRIKKLIDRAAQINLRDSANSTYSARDIVDSLNVATVGNPEIASAIPSVEAVEEYLNTEGQKTINEYKTNLDQAKQEIEKKFNETFAAPIAGAASPAAGAASPAASASGVRQNITEDDILDFAQSEGIDAVHEKDALAQVLGEKGISVPDKIESDISYTAAVKLDAAVEVQSVSTDSITGAPKEGEPAPAPAPAPITPIVDKKEDAEPVAPKKEGLPLAKFSGYANFYRAIINDMLDDGQAVTYETLRAAVQKAGVKHDDGPEPAIQANVDDYDQLSQADIEALIEETRKAHEQPEEDKKDEENREEVDPNLFDGSGEPEPQPKTKEELYEEKVGDRSKALLEVVQKVMDGRGTRSDKETAKQIRDYCQGDFMQMASKYAKAHSTKVDRLGPEEWVDMYVRDQYRYMLEEDEEAVQAAKYEFKVNLEASKKLAQIHEQEQKIGDAKNIKTSGVHYSWSVIKGYADKKDKQEDFDKYKLAHKQYCKAHGLKYDEDECRLRFYIEDGLMASAKNVQGKGKNAKQEELGEE